MTDVPVPLLGVGFHLGYKEITNSFTPQYSTTLYTGPVYRITLPPGCLNDLSFFNIPLPPQLRKRVLLMHLSTSGTQLTFYSHPNFECTSSVQMAVISTLLLCYLFFFLCSDIHCDVYLNGLIGYLFWL